MTLFPYTTLFRSIHCDLWGPYSIKTPNGCNYFLTIVDDFSRTTWIHLLKLKSDTQSILKHFINMVEKQYKTTVKKVRSDNGGEFKIHDFYTEKGIVHQTSCPYTPQQNSVVERKHQHLLNVARSLMFQSHLPKHFWGEAVMTAAYIINRIPTPVLKGKTPYEMLNKKAPDYNNIKVFGCLCFASSLPVQRSKFDSRSRKSVFLGYPANIKGYKCYDLQTKQIFISRDVIFAENLFPFEKDKMLDEQVIYSPGQDRKSVV